MKKSTKSGIFAILLSLTIYLFIISEITITVVYRGRTMYKCPKRGSKWVVVTSINYPTKSIYRFANVSDWITIVVADYKTPKDWQDKYFGSMKNVVFLTIAEQLSLDYDLIDFIPANNYARKNIGFLVAIQCGAEYILDTDDDNCLVGTSHIDIIPPEDLIVEAVPTMFSSWPTINPYAYYGYKDVWPRGYPLPAISESSDYEFYNVGPFKQVNPWIQQGLADLDPDVDAILRLTQSRLIGNIKFNIFPKALHLGKGTYAPFNSQNTIYARNAFWGLLLPFSTSMRVCDIWRGYWVQRVLWEINGSLIFRNATVAQIRNAHDYLSDFKQETALYNQAGKLVQFLQTWTPQSIHLYSVIKDLITQMATHEFWDPVEIKVVEAWLKDLNRIGYKPPKMLSPTSETEVEHSLQPIRVSVCVTGQMDRFSATFQHNKQLLHNFFKFNERTTVIDYFYYISNFNSSYKEDEVFLKTKVDAIKGVLYEDPTLNTKHANVTRGLRKGWTDKNLWQQLYGLKRCFELTENEHVKYDYLVRLRTDHFIHAKEVDIFRNTWNALESTQIVCPKEMAAGGVNDRFAIGSYASMHYYMQRYDYINYTYVTTLLAERFLFHTLQYFNVSMTRLNWLTREYKRRKSN